MGVTTCSPVSHVYHPINRKIIMFSLGKITAVGLMSVGMTLGCMTSPVKAATTPAPKPTTQLAHPSSIGETGGGTAQQKPCKGEIENKRIHLADTIHFWYFTNDVRVSMRLIMNVRYHWCHDKPWRGKPYEVTGCYDLGGKGGLGPDSIFFRGVDVNPFISEVVGGASVNPPPFRINKAKDHNCETHKIDKSKQAWLWIKNPEHRQKFNTRVKAHEEVVITMDKDPQMFLGPKAMKPANDDTV